MKSAKDNSCQPSKLNAVRSSTTRLMMRGIKSDDDQAEQPNQNFGAIFDEIRFYQV
jgi:hypothetical protein